MRVAVLTLEGSRYGKRLLHRLAEAGRPADLVVVVGGGTARNVRLLRGMARRIGWVDALRYAVEEVGRPLADPAPERGAARPYHELAGAVAHARSVRTPELPAVFEAHGIDLCLLGQSGIVPPPVLAASRLGTLNAHPGWLPAYRGVDCAEWALVHEDFDGVGSSLHWVDAGIDTGPIVRRRPYRWRGDETLRSLSARLVEDCLSLLAEAAEEARTAPLPALPNEGGRQYHKMPWAQRRVAASRLAAFLARGAVSAASS
jgi:methionyl-tRNA formyltransferase